MQIIFEPKLSERTTMRLGGKAIAELRLNEVEDVLLLPEKLKELGGTVFVLGAGSNIIASDADLPLVLLRPYFNHSPKVLKSDGEKTWIQVGANYALPRFILHCAKKGLCGLEGLSGIPGSIGGAIAMNAGSFGTETCAHLDSITLYSEKTGIITVQADEFSYGYREFSVAKKFGIDAWFFILEATFILTQEEMNGINKKRIHDFLEKKSKQPIKAWSAGCVFKNPAPDKPAGMLIEQCGLKGKMRGGMQFSDMHANFLINTGKGSSEDAFYLIEEAQKRVLDEFGYMLKTEVKILCP